VVQDPKSIVDVTPKKVGDLIPTASYAKDYTDKMPHGQAGGFAKAENKKSPSISKVSSMKPNQETKLKDVSKSSIKRTEDDDSNIFSIPQADFAKEYTDKMPHGSNTMKAAKETGGEPSKPKVQQMAGGPTRKGGVRNAKLGDDVAGSTKVDAQKPKQTDKPGRESSPKDALKWGAKDYKVQTHGATNIVESGVVMKLNGKKKATFEIVNQSVLDRIIESYEEFGYKVSFERTQPSWKSDKKLMRLLRESINAKHNFATKTSKKLRTEAFKYFSSIVKNSYNTLYESRQEFINTIHSAFKKIESIAEQKYLNNLEVFQGMARLAVDEDIVDVELVTEATDHQMALRQIQNTIFEEYGFDTKIRHIFVDSKKYDPRKIQSYSPKV
jgi:hypothetical protein